MALAMAKGDDRSDMFSVRKSAPESIAPVAEVLTPPEELRKQRLQKIAIATVLALLLAATAWTVWHFVHAAGVEEAAIAAGDTGRPADVEVALGTLGEGEMPGLRARLLAMDALAGVRPIDEVAAALERVPEDEEHLSERLKAETYLRLAEGEPAAAQSVAGRLIAIGTYAAETANAKSLAAFANGDLGTAANEARGATSVHPEAPRYAAQLALSLSLSGDADGALAALDAVAAPEAPAIALARARTLARARREGAAEAAAAAKASEAATPTERAWATLVEAWVAAVAGDHAQARETAAAALESPPPGDSLFRWRAAEVLLRAGDAEAARSAVAGLSGPTPDPSLAGLVAAGLAVAAGDGSAAIEALGRVPAIPAALVLVARAQELAGDAEAARAAWARAAEAAGWEAEAFAGRAALELAEDEPEAAAGFARQSLEADPEHPAHVPVAVAALLAVDADDEALRVASAATEARPEDPRLLRAKADAHLAKAQWAEALEALRGAVEQGATGAALQAKLGEAARQVGEEEAAVRAFEAALEEKPDQPLALVGLFRMHVEAHRLDEAAELQERIDEEDLDRGRDTEVAPLVIDPDEVRRVVTRFLVDWGAGLGGTRYVIRSTRRRALRREASLRGAIAELYLQGELYRPAVGMFGQVIRLRGDRLQAQLGKAYAHALDGRNNLASLALQAAVDAAPPDEEGGESPATSQPRYLVTRGRVELNLGRVPSARRFAERALAAEPGNTAAHLLLAQATIRMRRDPTDELRAAIAYPRPQPLAWALLADRLGPTEEGCRLAERYLDATNRNAAEADAMERLRERCAEREEE